MLLHLANLKINYKGFVQCPNRAGHEPFFYISSFSQMLTNAVLLIITFLCFLSWILTTSHQIDLILLILEKLFEEQEENPLSLLAWQTGWTVSDRRLRHPSLLGVPWEHSQEKDMGSGQRPKCMKPEGRGHTH